MINDLQKLSGLAQRMFCLPEGTICHTNILLDQGLSESVQVEVLKSLSELGATEINLRRHHGMIHAFLPTHLLRAIARLDGVLWVDIEKSEAMEKLKDGRQ